MGRYAGGCSSHERRPRGSANEHQSLPAMAEGRRQGHRPSISVSTAKLRNVRMSTIRPRIARPSRLGDTAIIPTMSAATRSSSPKRMDRPRRRRSVGQTVASAAELRTVRRQEATAASVPSVMAAIAPASKATATRRATDSIETGTVGCQREGGDQSPGSSVTRSWKSAFDGSSRVIDSCGSTPVTSRASDSPFGRAVARCVPLGWRPASPPSRAGSARPLGLSTPPLASWNSLSSDIVHRLPRMAATESIEGCGGCAGREVPRHARRFIWSCSRPVARTVTVASWPSPSR